MGINVRQQVVEARKQGASYRQISDQFGVARSTAYDWVVAHEKNVDKGITAANEPIGYVNETFQRDKPVRFKKTEDEVLEFLSQLKPISLSYTRPSSSRSLSS